MIGATLFSGIGAPEQAMPEWRWAWCAEIEPFPAAVLSVRHPNSINLGDVTADDFAERAAAIARPDVIVFGSPCQDFSVAGKRLGMAGARGNLALVALGIIGRLRPPWFVFENVPGLLSNWSGAEDGPLEAGAEWESVENGDFAAFLGAVDELGYSGAWASLDAQYRGVAQRRERLFFVGHLGDWRYPAAVLLEPQSLCGDSPPRREARENIAPTISARTKGGGGLGTDFDCDGGLITHALRAEGFDASEDGTGRGTPIVAAFGGNRTSGSIDVARGLNAPAGRCDFESETFVVNARQDPDIVIDRAHCLGRQHNGMDNAIAVALRGRDGGATAELSDIPSALRASQGGGDKPYVLTSGVRRLTPRECERLQGFPDDYTLITYRGKPAADGPRYRALGNSMAVPVMRMILERIEEVAVGTTSPPDREVG